MALISCPECSKEISDKVQSCPHCGYPMTIDSKEENISPQKVEVTDVKIKGLDDKGKRKVVTIVVAVVLFFALYGIIKSIQSSAFIQNIALASDSMLDGAIKAEEAGGLLHDVWYNSIYEERDSTTNKYTTYDGSGYGFYDDFNTALSNLYADEEFQSQITSIQINQMEVNDIMKKLTNVPEKHQIAYGVFMDLYDSYLSLTQIVVDSSGQSLTSFTDTFNSADTDFLKYYKQLGMYFE